MTDNDSADDYLERVKAEIRADADRARQRQPLPRIDPPPFEIQATVHADGIERERLDYALSELTGAQYDAFVDQAFRALLKRPPDEVGHAVQMTLLAAGAAKAEILGNLRWSPEGRHIGARVRGLLPRYVLAKASRVPVIGYGIEWAIALAGLPILMRHQRAADTSVSARFDELGHAQQQTRTLHEQLQAAHSQSTADHLRSFDEVRLQLGQLFTRADAIDGRITQAGNERSAMARELAELRHHVHVANHWVTSLQRSLDILENDAGSRANDSATAHVEEESYDASAVSVLSRQRATWAAQLATQLPTGAQVFDLGSGDGDWLATLSAAGIAASGIDNDPARVARAREYGLDVALGEPLATLARIADRSLTALSIDAHVLASAGDAQATLLDAKRVLTTRGVLLLRIESVREPSDRRADTDVHEWTAAVERAGFEHMRALIDGDFAALFAECP